MTSLAQKWASCIYLMNEFWSKTPCEDAGARQLGRVVAQETHVLAAHGDTHDQIMTSSKVDPRGYNLHE